MNKLQIGFIEISEEMLESFWTNNRELVPLDMEISNRTLVYKYLCYSKHFRILKEGDKIPYYEFEYLRDEKSGLCLLMKIKEREDFNIDTIAGYKLNEIRYLIDKVKENRPDWLSDKKLFWVR